MKNVNENEKAVVVEVSIPAKGQTLKFSESKVKTIVVSNGSKWFGQAPDKIEKLLEVLKTEVIEERFFAKYKKFYGDKWNFITLCPISKQHPLSGGRDKHYTFFGNFEGVSHVFNIETNDPALIEVLKAAIMANE